MSNGILAQILLDLILSLTKFSLQFDKTTNVSNLSQLEDMIEEDFLFC